MTARSWLVNNTVFTSYTLGPKSEIWKVHEALKKTVIVTGSSLILAQFCQCLGIIRLVVKIIRSWRKK